MVSIQYVGDRSYVEYTSKIDGVRYGWTQQRIQHDIRRIWLKCSRTTLLRFVVLMTNLGTGKGNGKAIEEPVVEEVVVEEVVEEAI